MRLAPASADWTALTTRLNTLTSSPPAAGGLPVKLEIAYRQPLNQHVRLVSGRFPAAPALAPASYHLPPRVRFYPVLQVLVTQQTAARFDLKPGSKVKIPGPELPLIGQAPAITLEVSGIVAPVDAGLGLLDVRPDPGRPRRCRGRPPRRTGSAGCSPPRARARRCSRTSAGRGSTSSGLFPLALGALTGDQAQPLSDALTGLSTRTLPLSADVAPVSDALAATSSLLPALASFISAAQSADMLLWLLYVSLTAAGLVVLLLAARMVVLRRSAELALIRARGASLWRLAGTVGAEAAVVCVPAAVAGVALAVLAVPAAGPLQPPAPRAPGGRSSPCCSFAVCGPALMVAWQYRLPPPPARAAAAPAPARARARLVAEVALTAAAVAGILVFRQQGLQAGSGVNLYTSAAPVLVAVPAVIVVFRLYPLVLRWAAAGRGAHVGRARVPRPRPGGAHRAHPRAARVRPRPRAHRGRVRRHGARRGDQRRGRRVMAGRRRGRDGHARRRSPPASRSRRPRPAPSRACPA